MFCLSKSHLLGDITNLDDVDASCIDFEFRDSGVERGLRHELPENGEHLDLDAPLGADGNDTVGSIDFNAIGRTRVGETATRNLVRGFTPLQLCHSFVADS